MPRAMGFGLVEDEHVRTNHYASDAFGLHREVNGGADTRSHTRARNIGVVTLFLFALIYVDISSLRTLPCMEARQRMGQKHCCKHKMIHCVHNGAPTDARD